MTTFVGIDLGTTFSVVARITPEGRPEVVPNLFGNALTPSVVELDADPPLVGEPAKEKLAAGSTTAAAFFKRFMGDSNYRLQVRGKSYSPVDLSGLVLAHLKHGAEDRLGDVVQQAVITVPAYFNDFSRRATMEAGQLAGLELLGIINEPTAAAFAYGLRPLREPQRLMVYDLGGGTFDVTIIEIEAEEQRVIATGGNQVLGGKTWDDALFLYLQDQFRDEYGEELAGEDFQALLVYAEELKKRLSAQQRVEARVQAGGRTGVYPVERSQFEQLTSHLLASTQTIAEEVLAEAKLNWGLIDHVLLVGGSTRMPMVRRLLEGLTGKPPLTSVNPDEAVAMGAAIYAAMEMAKRAPPGTPHLRLAGAKRSIDVMSHSLGMIAVNEDRTAYVNSIILPKNRPIPMQETRPYRLHLNRRGESILDVYMTQGEDFSPGACDYLGKYVFSGIPRLTAAEAILDITYAYDANGRVQVSAVEQSTRTPLRLTVEPLPEDIPDRFLRPPEAEQTQVGLPIIVYLAFDLSGSMSGNPLVQAKRAAHGFVKQFDLATTSIGIIAFSDGSRVKLAASQDAGQVTAAIDGLRECETGVGNAGDPFDDIFQQLAGAQRGRDEEVKRFAVVLADGVWAHQERAVGRAQRCHAAGIDVIGIGFGTADTNFLKRISSSDDLSFFTSQSGLVETFSSIAQEISAGRLGSGLVQRT